MPLDGASFRLTDSGDLRRVIWLAFVASDIDPSGSQVQAVLHGRKLLSHIADVVS